MPANNGKEEGSVAALQKLLSELDIEPCYHSLILMTCSHKEDYLKDIEAEDLHGKLDANDEKIPAAVARGLVRKLQMSDNTISTPANSSVETDTSLIVNSQEKSTNVTHRPCNISLVRGSGAYHNILKCDIRGQFLATDGGGNDASSRGPHKILTAILDNSYSMLAQWPLVVDAIARVFTDQLLQDDNVKLILIVYNTNACEVALPTTAAELTSLLKSKHRPNGLTNFKDAFVMAQRYIRRDVESLAAKQGISVSAVDITTLLFTDGQDTSMPPLGYLSQAATDKARKAGDDFRSFLSNLNCRTHYTCIAAFGEHHNPDQCQYLSDRYYYINRPEVLSDWLSSGLADLLESSGFCSIQVKLPPGVTLAERLPKRIGLQGGGHVLYEIWLYTEEEASFAEDVVVVAKDSDAATLHASATLSSATVVEPNSLNGRLYLLDFGEMQLRDIAQDLIGRRPSQSELALLRERLAGVKVLSQPVEDVARCPKARLCGRALLLARLDELEARRKRLSYALGHFEEEENGDSRRMGAVGIDAVLRDASQRVALSAVAMKHTRRVEMTVAMPLAEDLSEYGKKMTHDPISGCNAKEVADQGDALFYQVSDILWKDGHIIESASEHDVPIALSVFELLSNNRKESVEGPSGAHIMSGSVGIPVFGSPGHFARANLFLRNVLEHFSPIGKYTGGSSELLFVDLLSHYLSSQLRKSHTLTLSSAAVRSHGLFHRARSLVAILGSTHGDSPDKTVLDDIMEEVSCFLDQPESRPKVKNLYRVLALGLLSAEYWPAQRFEALGRAILEESKRRSISHCLAGLSGSDRLKLAWALMGPGQNGDQWLDCPIQDHASKKLHLESFCFQKAAADLEMLEEQSPECYSPRNCTLVSQALSSAPPGTPPIGEWRALRSMIMGWGAVLQYVQASSSGGLWNVLDEVMVNESSPHTRITKLLGEVLTPEPAVATLRESVTDPDEPMRLLSDLVCCCIATSSYSASGKVDKGDLCSQPLRLVLASKIRSYVNQRAEYAIKHPIQGAAYPTSQRVSPKDMHLWWGEAAYPINEPLYREVRRSIHRKHPKASVVVKEALTDKAYSKQGGHFEFRDEFDTFIPGLHRRTRDLHDAWERKHKPTHGAKARAEAVEEMLLRLRWDHRDDRARAKLSEMVAQVWDGLEGITSHQPIPSALWIDGTDERKSGTSVPDFVITSAPNGGALDMESVTTSGETWSVL